MCSSAWMTYAHSAENSISLPHHWMHIGQAPRAVKSAGLTCCRAVLVLLETAFLGVAVAGCRFRSTKDTSSASAMSVLHGDHSTAQALPGKMHQACKGTQRGQRWPVMGRTALRMENMPALACCTENSSKVQHRTADWVFHLVKTVPSPCMR